MPIDKTNGNITFAGKRFYAQTLLKEIGLTTKNTFKAYAMVKKISELEILNKHSKDIYSITIYWLTKHKALHKARHITAAPKCSLKLLSKPITSAWKLSYNQVWSYNNKNHFSSGVKSF